MSEGLGRRRASHRVLLAVLWLTLLVLAMKLWIGWATQSMSLVSQALHTLISSFSIFLSLVAVSSRHGIERDLWGHSKVEAVLTFLLIAFLGFAGFNLLAIAAQQLQLLVVDPSIQFPSKITLPLIQILGLAAAISFCLSFFLRLQARLLESATLRMTVAHSLQDSWLAVLVLGGLVGIWQGLTWLDPLLTLVMVALLMLNCWQLLNRQLPSMLQQVAIAPEALAKTIHQVEGILHCYDMRSRGIVGRLVYVEMHLILHPEFASVTRTVIERVERVLRQQYGPVRIVVYIDSDRPSPEHPAQSIAQS